MLERIKNWGENAFEKAKSRLENVETKSEFGALVSKLGREVKTMEEYMPYLPSRYNEITVDLKAFAKEAGSLPNPFAGMPDSKIYSKKVAAYDVIRSSLVTILNSLNDHVEQGKEQWIRLKPLNDELQKKLPETKIPDSLEVVKEFYNSLSSVEHNKRS